MKHPLKRITLAALIALAPAAALPFDFGNAKDMDRLKKAFDIGGKLVKSKRDINQDEEIQIGDGIAAQVLGASPLVDDPALQKYVNRVGLWLALQTDRPDLPWRFGVIATDDVNAFSMPGGTVLITRGMYTKFTSEAELAGVLAHEISHVVSRHQLKQIQKQLGNEWKMDLVNAVAEEKNNKRADHIARAFSAGTEIFTRGLDKQDEYAADRDGVVVAARGGYNPYALYGVLQTLGEISAEDSKVALMFKTHPSPSMRQDQLSAAMGETLDAWAGGVEKTQRFVKPAAVKK